MRPEVTLSIDGRTHSGWKEVRIRRSIDAMTGSFELTLSRREHTNDEPRTIAAGAACSVAIDGKTIITGWIDIVSPSRYGEDHVVAVTGRDRAADLVDCSAIAKPGSWRNAPLKTIIDDLVKPFGITVNYTAPTGANIRRFALQQGETVQAAIERLCRFRALLAWSRADGSIEIGTPGKGASIGRLVEGETLKEFSADFGVSGRFGSYIVKGQSAGDDEAHGRTVAQVQASAKDAAVTRHRPLLIVAEEDADKAQLEKRANWEANVRAARGQTVRITLVGWLDPTGNVWAPDSKVDVFAPSIFVDSTMLVVSVELSRNDQDGTLARLELQRPEAWTQLAVPEDADASSIRKKGSKAA